MQCVRNPAGPAMKGAFESDRCADGESGEHPRQDDDFLLSHASPPPPLPLSRTRLVPVLGRRVLLCKRARERGRGPIGSGAWYEPSSQAGRSVAEQRCPPVSQSSATLARHPHTPILDALAFT